MEIKTTYEQDFFITEVTVTINDTGSRKESASTSYFFPVRVTSQRFCSSSMPMTVEQEFFLQSIIYLISCGTLANSSYSGTSI